MDESDLPLALQPLPPDCCNDTLEHIYKMETPRLTRLFRQRLGGPDEARDFVQDLFVLLIAYGRNHHISEPRALLSRLIRNKFSDLSRKRKRRSDLFSISFEDQPDVGLPATQTHAIEAEDMMRQYLGALDALAPRTREIFLLHRVQEKSYKDIASELDISVRTVEWHIGKALLHITRALDQE